LTNTILIKTAFRISCVGTGYQQAMYAGVVPVHRACSTVEFLRQETPDFISLDLWLPISPHLNTAEYKTWGCIQKQWHTRSQYVTWLSEAATGGIWADFKQTVVDKVTDQ